MSPRTDESKQVVVIGVSGSGKSTVGSALADRLERSFVDGDDLHSDEAVERMAAGIPLTDDDRWPWLVRVRDVLLADRPVVVACSALRRSYRDVLRQAGDVVFVHLHIDEAEARARLDRREGHFMRVGMVRSQFEDLEPPSEDESDVATVGSADVATVVDRAAVAVSTINPIGDSTGLADG